MAGTDWSSIHGVTMRNQGELDSMLGSMRGTDIDSLHGTSMRDVDSVHGEERNHESNMVLTEVANFMEQLRLTGGKYEEKERIVAQLSHMSEDSVDARAAIGYHAQAIPLLVGLLRSGSTAIKTYAAATLSHLCEEDELRVKVLLGGCIPPILALLKAPSLKTQMVAAEALFAVSKGGPSRDSVGTKIFATEGVVPALLEQLQPGVQLDPDVVGLLTGTMRNLCYSVENFWPMTSKSDGVNIFVQLLPVGRPAAQENAAALLTSYLTSPLLLHSTQRYPSRGGSEEDLSEPAAQAAANALRVMEAGAVPPLLRLLGVGNPLPLRTEAAGTLRALSGGNEEVRAEIEAQGGELVMIRATVAPSTEMMQTGYAQMLQENAMGALSNIAGGKAEVVAMLASRMERAADDQELADVTGALAYALMVMEGAKGIPPAVSAVAIEEALVRRLEPGTPSLVQERAVEALASLYGNHTLAASLTYAEAKKMLVGLITLATPDSQAELIHALIMLCTQETDVWTAMGGREGVLGLVALLGLSTEDQQEYSVTLLYILTTERDESKWAITAAGGIPPLVQLLGTGTSKAREDAAAVLSNLCKSSEDIRACVETAEATPALLSLLGSGSTRGQKVSAMALMKLVSGSNANATTIGHLTGILLAEQPESKLHVLRVLGHLLAEAPDVAEEGTASNEALQTLVALLDSEREESQGNAAAVLANLFAAREDLRESRSVIEAISSLIRLVDYGSEPIAMQAARGLAAIFCSIDTNFEAAQVAKDGIFPLVKLARSPATAVAEVATTALANLLANEELAQYAPAEEVVQPLSRLLREGTAQGKEHAAGALAHLLHSRTVDNELAGSIEQCSTVLALVGLLTDQELGEDTCMAALEALAALARAKTAQGFVKGPLQNLSKNPEAVRPLVECLAQGSPVMREKAIEVLSRLCKDLPADLGMLIASTQGCIAALAERIIGSPSLEVKVGGTALLICAAKEHRQATMEAMMEAGSLLHLIQCLVEMLASRASEEVDQSVVAGEASGALVNSVAMWLLAVIASHDSQSKVAVAKLGAVEVLTDKLAVFSPNARKMDVLFDDGGSWVSALLLAILFRDRDVTRTSGSARTVSPLINLLKSQEPSDRYFAAQGLASLVISGSRGTLLAVANGGATAPLIAMLGNADSNSSHLVSLANTFSLANNPEQVALEQLLKCEDIRCGPTAHRIIPSLVDMLKPMPERVSAPPLALGLLKQIAVGSNMNKVTMAEAGVLEALTKYLSLGPQEYIEEAIAELMRILFASQELREHPAARACLEQLVAVLRLGSRGARLSAARALECLFLVEPVRCSEMANQAVQPLVEMLGGGPQEQGAAVTTLAKLAARNTPKITAIMEASDGHAMDALSRILVLPEADFEVKEDTAELLRILFALAKVRASSAAKSSIAPLVGLLLPCPEELATRMAPLQYQVAAALDQLMDDEQQGDHVAEAGAVRWLCRLMDQESLTLHSTVISALYKLAKERPLCKVDMAGLGIMERMLDILPVAPNSLACRMVELMRLLCSSSTVARGVAGDYVVVPLLDMLRRPDLPLGGKYSVLQTLAYVLEKPGRLEGLELEPRQALEPLLPLLNAEAIGVQELAAQVSAHLLQQESFQRDQLAMEAVPMLVRLLALETDSLQREGLRALECVSKSWPNAIAEAGGIEELSRLVATSPQPTWQLAATVLTNVLSRDKHYSKVPIPVLVRLLHSSTEQIQLSALTALLALEHEDAERGEAMAETGVIEALLELLRMRQAEEAAARLLEALFNNPKVRESPAAARAVAPLAAYLQDPESRDGSAKLLATLALGDLFQDSSLAQAVNSIAACRALVSVLGDQQEQPSEELQMVALCGLQNMVANSRPNKRVVAEDGGIQVLGYLLDQSTSDVTAVAAGLVRLLFNNHSIQEYVTPDLVEKLTKALDRELRWSVTANEEVVRAIETLLQNFSRLRLTESATAAIPALVGAMKVGNEDAQEAALNSLFLLRQCWSANSTLARVQSVAASEAIPVLQLLLRSGPKKLFEKAETLLAVLPGSFTVIVKRASNLKMAMGTTNAYCKVTLGEGTSRITKVIPQSTDPEWRQSFSWSLDCPPTGQKFVISCKSKTGLGKGNLGKVAIEVDRVVTLGTASGTYSLQPETNRDGSQRTIEVEFVWSNR